MLPKDEENHAVVCLGVIEDDVGFEDDLDPLWRDLMDDLEKVK